MGSTMTTNDGTTLAQRFAAWLTPALRRAGYNIDAQRGGGRTKFAEAVGVSQSTVTRWLNGQLAPDPSLYDAIANALDVDPVRMLVETGIISAKAATQHPHTDVRLRPISPAQAADDLDITDPGDRALFVAMVERLARQRHTPTEPNQQGEGGDVAAEG